MTISKIPLDNSIGSTSIFNSDVCHCSNVSKIRFDLDSITRQTFGHTANGPVKINGHNTVGM